MNRTDNIRAFMKRFRTNCCRVGQKPRRAVAATEFALTLPLWITMLLGTADGTYCLLVNEKCDRIAYTVTDIVAQYQTQNPTQLGNLTVAGLNDIILAGAQLMQPFPFTATQGANVITTSVYKPAGKSPIICWQYNGAIVADNAATQSRVGIPSNSDPNHKCATGGAATLPNGLTLNDNDNVIISEVFYNFSPLFISSTLFNASTIYRVAVYKPRLSPLINTPS